MLNLMLQTEPCYLPTPLEYNMIKVFALPWGRVYLQGKIHSGSVVRHEKALNEFSWGRKANG